MKWLTAFALGLALAPISALIQAKAMSKLWEWFVARDYGTGPSMAAWYGLAGVFSLAITPSLLGMTKEKKDESKPIESVLSRAIGMWIGTGLLLCFAWFVGFLLHWV